MSTDLERFRAEYEKLRPLIPDFPGDREWTDRLRTWEDFTTLGPLVAADFRDLEAIARRGKEWARMEVERRRAMMPEMLDLVMRAFPNAK